MGEWSNPGIDLSVTFVPSTAQKVYDHCLARRALQCKKQHDVWPCSRLADLERVKKRRAEVTLFCFILAFRFSPGSIAVPQKLGLGVS